MKSITIGMDIGDKKNSVCVLNKDGEVIKTCEVSNNLKSIEKFFRSSRRAEEFLFVSLFLILNFSPSKK